MKLEFDCTITEEDRNLIEKLKQGLMKKLDLSTRYHSKQVADYCISLSKLMKYSEDETYVICTAALLHDIGKINISPLLLNKPSSLDSQEYDIIKSHPVGAIQIIRTSCEYSLLSEKGQNLFEHILNAISSHHERYSDIGCLGYPIGLQGNNIPFIARLISVADSFDAMTSDRPYKDAIPIDSAVNELIRFKGKQFDPVITNYMVRLISELNIRDRRFN